VEEEREFIANETRPYARDGKASSGNSQESHEKKYRNAPFTLPREKGEGR